MKKLIIKAVTKKPRFNSPILAKMFHHDHVICKKACVLAPELDLNRKKLLTKLNLYYDDKYTHQICISRTTWKSVKFFDGRGCRSTCSSTFLNRYCLNWLGSRVVPGEASELN